jgi:hypothetical protein
MSASEKETASLAEETARPCGLKRLKMYVAWISLILHMLVNFISFYR